MARAASLIRTPLGTGVAGSSLRAAVALTACVGIGQALGHPEWGLFAALGALLVALADTGGPYGERAVAMVVGLVGASALVAVGTAVSGHRWLGIAILAAVAFGCGLVRAHGTVGVRLATVLALAYLFGFGISGSAGEAGSRAAAAALGGLGTMLLVGVVWPLRPDLPVRARIAEALTALASLADATAAGSGTAAWRNRVRDAIERVRAELDSLGVWRPERDPTAERLVDLYWRVAQLLAATTVLERSLETRTGPLPEPLAGGIRALAAAERILAGYACGEPLARPKASQGVSAPAEPVVAARALRLAFEQCDAIAAGLEGVLAERHAVRRPFRRRSSAASSVARFVATVRAELAPGDAGLHHAVRLSLAATAAAAIASSFGLQRSYWAALTVVVILQPDFTATLKRTGERVVGTVIGVIGMAILLALVSSGPWLDPLVFAATFGFFVFLTSDYRWAAVSITALILTLIELVEPSGWELAGYRLVDTLIGVAVVVAVSALLWRRPEPRVTRQTLAAVPRSAAGLLARVSDAAAGARVELALVSDDRRALGVSLLRADALVQRLGTEPRASGPRDIVAAGQRVTDALNALLMLLADPEGDARLRFDGLAHELAAALTDLEGAIGSGRAPAPLPDFARALDDLRRQADGSPERALEVDELGALVAAVSAMAKAAAPA